MQTELPRRPYVELPPPADGLAAARHEASRRRTRRALVAVSGAVTAGVVGAVVVLLGGGKDLAVLRPAPVAPANQPTPSAAPVSTSRPLTAPGAATTHPLRSAGSAGHPTAVGSAPEHHAGGGASQAGQSPSGQVTVTRTSGRNSGGPRVCRTGASGDNSGVRPGDNWCTGAAASATGGGERLSYTLCRDSTTGGTLHFAASREVELRVLHNGAVVWRYSAHAVETSSPHTLTAAADDCWTWSLVWPGRTDAGGAAPEARYTLTAISTADEFAGATETAVTFDY